MAKTLIDKLTTADEQTTKWANNAYGKIVYIEKEDTFRFVDCLGESGKPKDSKVDEKTCPIVATGFVSFWLRNQKLTFSNAYKSYYAHKLAEYEMVCQFDLDLCDQDNKRDFITYKHLNAERKAIKVSEAIFPYLTEDDVNKIKKITAKYLTYARKQRNDYFASKYPKNERIERSFLAHYEYNGAALECVEWLRIEFNLPNMSPHWHSNRKTGKEQLEGIWKERHEVEIPIDVREDLEDFDESIMDINGGLMEEIHENLKSYTSLDDRVRYITSLVTPFKDFALPFYPNSQIAEREHSIKELKEKIKYWETISDDEIDGCYGKPINPKRQIEACKEMIERYENDIEYWDNVQTRFNSFSQPYTSELRPEENIEMCKHLELWFDYMHSFAHKLASLALLYGIKLMDVQETCGVYIIGQMSFIDYIDEHYIKDYQHAQKLLDAIMQDKGMTDNKKTAHLLSKRIEKAEKQFNEKYPFKDIDIDNPILSELQYEILNYLSLQPKETENLIGVKEIRLFTSIEIALACRDMVHSGLIFAFIEGDYENEDLSTSALLITDNGRIALRNYLRHQTEVNSTEATTETKKITKKVYLDYGFNIDKILSLISAEHKDIIADILIENLHSFVGKNSPKFALLPIYCAIYEINWIALRPEYDDFVAAFPGIVNNATSYKNYVPTVKNNSYYHNKSCRGIDIDNMCESLQTRLNERIKQKKE